MLKVVANTFFVLLIALIVLFIFWQAPVEYLEQFITDNSLLSISVFVFLIVLSTVFAPLTVLPIVPVVALFFGSFNTAIYTMSGWIIGSAISFWIARYLGKPVLDKFVSKKEILKYHKYVPEDIHFWWVVFLRMIIPVDVLSYLIGLLTKMSMKKYLLATVIGVIPFSFIFAYGFEILFFENILAVILTSVFLVAILYFIWYFHRKGKI